MYNCQEVEKIIKSTLDGKWWLDIGIIHLDYWWAYESHKT
jgi:hypothetical protein